MRIDHQAFCPVPAQVELDALFLQEVLELDLGLVAQVVDPVVVFLAGPWLVSVASIERPSD